MEVHIEHSHWLGIATINATILSILLGAFFGYLLLFHGRADELRHSVYLEANKVNRLRFAGIFGLGSNAKYVCDNDETRKKRLQELVCIGMGVPCPDLPDDKKEQGEEALRIISALSSYYPFPQRVKPGLDGGITPLIPPERLQFKSIDDVEKWIENIEHLAGTLLWLWAVHQQTLRATIDSVIQEEQKRTEEMQRSVGEDEVKSDVLATLERLSSGKSLERLVSTFFVNLAEAQKIAESAEEKLITWQTYEQRVESSTRILRYLFVFAMALFLVGVLLPMIHWVFRRQRLLLVVSLSPFAFYISLFIYLLVMLG